LLKNNTTSATKNLQTILREAKYLKEMEKLFGAVEIVVIYMRLKMPQKFVQHAYTLNSF